MSVVSLSTQQCNTDITHRSLLSLHTASHYTQIWLHTRLRENLQKFTVDGAMRNERSHYGLNCLEVVYGCMVLLGGKIGRNWWRCPPSTPLDSTPQPGPLLSSPLLYLQQHNTSQSRQTPAQTADNYNSQYLTSHISLTVNQ